ncbi:hypothetical protein LTR37_004142 [Vermiconidia calcicola]|uniref:Uncharacterized protein n=1 Tax=Vermiconidia calcicola TaxID=1690605 RepID=A0ACC3NMU1_9PEZI|nr:hypothetical protein LTR37_004142 [Vermiconidia calcicola]
MNSHQEHSLSVIAGLQNNADFSDLTIKCHGREFRVHRAVVCQFSPVIADQCNSTFREGVLREIEHEQYTASTVERMLSYMYSQWYTVTGDRPIANSSAGNDGARKDSFVHGIADYYNIPLLQQLAADRFRGSIKERWSQGLVEVIREVYDKAGSNDKGLVDALSQAASEHSTQLMTDTDFLSKISKEQCHNDFMHAVIRQLSASLAKARDDCSTEQLQLSISTDLFRQDKEEVDGHLRTAKEQLIQEKKDMLGLERLMLMARCCRHCRYDHKRHVERTDRHENGRHCVKCSNCGTREEGVELTDLDRFMTAVVNRRVGGP